MPTGPTIGKHMAIGLKTKAAAHEALGRLVVEHAIGGVVRDAKVYAVDGVGWVAELRVLHAPKSN